MKGIYIYLLIGSVILFLSMVVDEDKSMTRVYNRYPFWAMFFGTIAFILFWPGIFFVAKRREERK